MGTRDSSQLTIPVRDDSPNVSPPDVSAREQDVDRPQTHKNSNLIEKAKDWYKKIIDRFCTPPKSVQEREKTLEGKAYKSLFDDLREPKKGKGYYTEVTINYVIFVVFFIVVFTFTVIDLKRHFLRKEIKSWLTLLMVLVCGLPFIRFLTYVILELFERLFKGNRFLVFYTKQMKRYVDVSLWFLVMLWVWYTFFRFDVVKDTKGAHVLHTSKREYQRVLKIVVKQITRLMMAITIGALLWTIKTAIFLALKADLYYKKFCPRIRQSILDLHAIGYIEQGPTWEFIPWRQNPSLDGQSARRADAQSIWMKISYLDKDKTPIWIIKRLVDVYLENMKNKPQILRNIEGIDHDDKKLMHEARDLHKRVISRRGASSTDPNICREDLKQYGLNFDEITRVFQLFKSKGRESSREDVPIDDPEKERITQDQFLRWTLLALKNCLGLELALQNSDFVFWKLEMLMDLCVVLITTVIWILLSEIVSVGQSAILLAPFFGASYIYTDSVKGAFGGITFVFGMHPFDVGDRVKVENIEMKVKEINILTTVFVEYDSGAEVIYPNSKLAQDKVINLDITPDQPDSIEFTVPIDTPQELICDMQLKIKKTLDDDVTFTSDTIVAKKQITEKEVTLVVHFKYLVSYLSAETKARHRSKILSKIMRFRDDLKRKEEEISSDEENDILRFKIDADTKLQVIDNLKKEVMKICGKFKKNGSLIEHSQVLFSGICKTKISMDVKMIEYEKALDKNQLKKQIEDAVKNLQNREEKDEVASWVSSKSDLDENC